MDSSPRAQLRASAQQSSLFELRTMAEQGDADAQFSLGLRYGCGVGGDPDFVQAAHWYHKAADQDHALAQYHLGRLFTLGQGVPQDEAIAAGWIRKAAEGGDAAGQHTLGVRCHRASLDPNRGGAAESRIEAYKWFRLAAAQDYRGSLTAWQGLALTMSWAEVNEGNHRAAVFAVRKPAHSAAR